MDTTRSLLENIWMVDDDEDDILVFENVLRGLAPATQFTAFATGDALLAQLATSSPDLLFLDLNMPRLDGGECLRQLRAAQLRPFSVIAYSGSDFGRAVDAAYEAGATLFLAKPMTVQQLAAQLRALLGLDWADPGKITRAHMQGERFVPFSVE